MNIEILIDMNLSPDWVDELSKFGWASFIGQQLAIQEQWITISCNGHDRMVLWFLRTTWTLGRCLL